MRSLAFLALLALVGCKSGRTEQAQTPDAWAPKFGRTKALYEVRDEKSGARIGFVERTTYDDGKVIYWVTGLDRQVKLGYILANNNGYKYEWLAGRRSKEPVFIGADTYQANARRILDHGSPVTLREIAWEDLLEEYETEKAPAGGAKGT
jgi:hypothetical protein